MPARLVALDEGPDIALDRAMVVVGRHPQCDARLDSLRVSRHHCCMTHDHGEVIVRDLGSTNGIRINGQRVEFGRLRPGDELSIAHIRYRLDNGQGHEATLADAGMPSHSVFRPRDAEPGGRELLAGPDSPPPERRVPHVAMAASAAEAAVRGILPSNVAERCRIEVIVHMDNDAEGSKAGTAAAAAPENLDGCRPDSSP